MKQAGLESFIKVFKVKDVGKNFKAEVDELCDRIVNVEKSTAIFCYSDPLAMRVLNSIWRKGIKIPEDLSVIGYGGLNYTEFSNPPLSTIKQPFFEMGCEAGKIIIQQINGGISSPVKKSLGVKLISRESTAINKGNRENE
jgi:LacI family repressor for deo operon, udp, cdd, tsx, nupC, and nupG